MRPQRSERASEDDDEPEAELVELRERIAEVEEAIAERDRTIARLEETLRSESPIVRHRAHVKELEAELAAVRKDAAEATRARAALPALPDWASPQLLALAFWAVWFGACVLWSR